jgi:hypothetical protein
MGNRSAYHREIISLSQILMINPDNSLGREMMVRQVATQFAGWEKSVAWPMDAGQAAKMAAN